MAKVLQPINVMMGTYFYLLGSVGIELTQGQPAALQCQDAQKVRGYGSPVLSQC